MNGTPITKEHSTKFKELYLKGESTRSIAKKYNRPHTSISRHIRLQGIKIRDKRSAAKLGVAKGRIPIKRNIIKKQKDKTDEDKAYILGTLCGDGWIYYKPYKKRFQIGLNTIDKEFTKKFRDCLNNTYGIKGKIQKLSKRRINWKEQYLVRICSKAMCEDLLKYGNFKTKTWNIPIEIILSTLSIQAKFIRGFFDSEGTVDKRSKRLSAVSSNLKGLNQIKLILENFKIRSKIRLKSDKKNYSLNIEDRKSIEIYHKYIGFEIKHKQDKLNGLILSYKQYQRLTQDLKKFIPKIKELRASGLSYENIGKKLGLPTTTVWHYSHVTGKG